MTSSTFLPFWLLSLLAFSGMSLTARAAAPTAPSSCIAAGIGNASGGAAIRISWNDNSTTETQWIIQYSVNGGAYSSLGTVASSTTATTGPVSVSWSGAVSNTTYAFKIFASNGTASSVAATSTSITTSVFTLTAGAVPGQTAVNLSWPNITNETGYQILYKAAGDFSYSFIALVGANVTTYQVTSPTIEAGKTYSFLVEPYINTSIIGDSNEASATVDGITSKTGTSGTPGNAFSHTFTQVTGSTISSRTLTGVPAGLSFNSSTGVLSGVYPAVGIYTLTYTANFTGGSLTQTFSIRVRPPAGPPVIGTIIPAWTGVAGASRDTALAGAFTDAEAESAVRVSTSLGDMDFILFNTATPATVTNFMTYVSAGKYTDVDFHRSIANFVIQGGGFKGAGTGSNFTSVSTNAAVTNEPGIANERGTVSMAKMGGDPNSATSQFFVSLGDNRANLDYQNGGFTVFGRVAGNGMAVADTISNLPSNTYNLFLDGVSTATTFSDFPINAASAPVSIDQTKLVKMNSVTTIPTLSYSVTGNTNPSVATAIIVNGQLHLVGLAGGLTNVTVTATDLDNFTTTQTVVINLTDTYATWASRTTFTGGQSGVTQNADGDVWNNLQEYAFLGDPAASNATSQAVFPGTSGVNLAASGIVPSAGYLTLTFPVRKFTQGLSYAVDASDGLSGTWTEIWKSANGFSHAQVVSALDQADRTLVTIKDTAVIGSRPMRFLRTRIVQE